ncbi:MAG: type III-A CRISPR-associated RAMP protein Csm3 [Bacteroidetes bacterium]|nr:type III-A CRISPR-associated RAMP protein Csm3 [Bacteroidota bacterium]MBT6686030.1 type III-A CRISPR-associated RAMP protein Csm3 [Bacteroidota bacterium]
MLKGIIKISGNIKAVSGISIGGSTAALETNVFENDIIKTSNGVPYISGNSLKGKMRDMLAKIEGSVDEESDFNSYKYISEIFGSPEEFKNGNIIGAKLHVKDAFANAILENGVKRYNGKSFMLAKTDYSFTEMKTENATDRNSKKSMPRNNIRTFSEVIFPFQMKYKIFEEDINPAIKHIKAALKFLQDDYIGGNGSRGYGQIEFQNVQVHKHLINEFEFDKTGELINQDLLKETIE